mgnify:FL=1
MRYPLIIAASLAASPAFAAPTVLTDIAPIHGMVAAVMGDLGTPDLLLPPGADPHDYALRPSDARTLSDASLIIWVGEGLTPWLAEPVQTLAKDAVTLELLDTEGWPKRELHHEDEADHDEHGEGGHNDHEDHDEHAGHDDHGEDDHDDHEGHDDHDDHDEHDAHAGHDHGDFDPHGWIEPAVVSVWVGHIAEALSEADPDNAAIYAANAAAYQAELADVRASLAAQLEPVAGKALIWPHDAYGYLQDAFGLNGVGTISDAAARTPGPAHIAALRDIPDVACVLSDPEVDARWTTLVIEGTGAKTVRIDPIGAEIALGPNHYVDTMQAIADGIAECLSAE